jgi:hypothetical protein
MLLKFNTEDGVDATVKISYTAWAENNILPSRAMVVYVVTTDVVGAKREVCCLIGYSLDGSGKFKYCS